MILKHVNKHPYIAAFFIILLYVFVVFYDLFVHFSTHILADDVFLFSLGDFYKGQSDIYNFFWSFWWVNHSFSLGEPILYSHWIFPPTGADLVFHTMTIFSSLMLHSFFRVFGTVVSFNLMILALLSLGTFSYFVFIRKTFSTSYASAVVSSILFGMNPYFVYKAHVHPNLIGHLFWGSALGILFFVYYRKRFTVVSSLLFALFFWLTFWQSFVEFFMLVVVGLLVFAVFEIHNRFWRDFRSFAGRILFFVPTVFGSVSFFVVSLSSTLFSYVNLPVYTVFPWTEIFSFPHTSILSLIWKSNIGEYFGVYFPLSLLVLIAFGVLKLYHSKSYWLLSSVFVLFVLVLFLFFNFGNFFGALFSFIPFAGGFRVFARFLPFVFFFACILALHGFEYVLIFVRGGGFRYKASFVFFLFFLVLEFYPFFVKTSSVGITLHHEVSQSVNREKYLYVFGSISENDPLTQLFFEENYQKRYSDIYAANFNMKTVRLSYLARSLASGEDLRNAYPYSYDGREFDIQGFLQECRELQVGYVLFPDKDDARLKEFPGTVLQEWDEEVFIELEE